MSFLLPQQSFDEQERIQFSAFIGGLVGSAVGGKERCVAGMEAGALVTTHQNFGIPDKDILKITEAVPENSVAAIFVIEHLQAKNLNQAINEAGGVLAHREF